MIFANCEIYENKHGAIGVLTRTEEGERSSFLQNSKDPQDISVNLDKRLIEFFLSDPTRLHTYMEWDKLLRDCGYETIFDKDYRHEIDDATSDDELYEINGHRTDSVKGFRVDFVPKGKLFRIDEEPIINQAGMLSGTRQVVKIYSKEDFIET